MNIWFNYNEWGVWKAIHTDMLPFQLSLFLIILNTNLNPASVSHETQDIHGTYSCEQILLNVFKIKFSVNDK